MSLTNRLATALIATILFLTARAQDVSDFGKVDVNLLKKPNSLIDKSAEAEVVFEVSDVSFSIMGGSPEIQTRNHVRIKIYNTNGLEQANISIPYYARNGLESISKLEAQTYNLNESGQITVAKLDKKSVYDNRIDNRYSKLTFTLPDVKAGSVIEYKYISKRQVIYLEDWTFQQSIPVMYSKFMFEHPNEFTFNEIPLNQVPIESSSKSSGYSVQKNFVCRNLPAVKKEPFMTDPKDYRQRITINAVSYNPAGSLSQDLRQSWPKIVREMMEDEDFGLQLTKNIQRTQDLDLQLQKLTDPYLRMAAVHNYVRANMAWDKNTSIWALDGVKKAWEKKRGNSGEINLILVNLLKDAGLNAYPVLVSTKDNGRIRPMDPSYTQFNTVMAYVTIDSGFYVLDATDKYTPSNLIPASVVYTEGLVISKLKMDKSLSEQEWGWHTLYNEQQSFSKLINVTAKMDPKGKVAGDAFVMFRDYARERFCVMVEPVADKTLTYYTSANEGAKVTDLVLKNETVTNIPLEHVFKFEKAAEANGDYFIYNLNAFTGLEKNPFIAEERYADVFFGYGQKFSMRGSFEIPEGYIFEAPPKSMKMIMPDKSIEMSRIVQVEGQTAKYMIQIDVKKPYYSPQEYDIFYEFYKKMYDMLNEPLVVKKK